MGEPSDHAAPAATGTSPTAGPPPSCRSRARPATATTARPAGPRTAAAGRAPAPPPRRCPATPGSGSPTRRRAPSHPGADRVATLTSIGRRRRLPRTQRRSSRWRVGRRRRTADPARTAPHRAPPSGRCTPRRSRRRRQQQRYDEECEATHTRRPSNDPADVMSSPRTRSWRHRLQLELADRDDRQLGQDALLRRLVRRHPRVRRRRRPSGAQRLVDRRVREAGEVVGRRRWRTAAAAPRRPTGTARSTRGGTAPAHPSPRTAGTRPAVGGAASP